MDKNTSTYMPKGNFTYFCNLTTDIIFCKTTLMLLNFNLYIHPFCIKGPPLKSSYADKHLLKALLWLGIFFLHFVHNNTLKL
jgi:hypothetical protein